MRARTLRLQHISRNVEPERETGLTWWLLGIRWVSVKIRLPKARLRVDIAVPLVVKYSPQYIPQLGTRVHELFEEILSVAHIGYSLNSKYPA